ncbi:MAG: MBL fold metallo-hydrolase, partial [Chloroflexi bacterium]
RTDFPGCSYPQLIEAIRTQILSLPDDYKLYPGHGPFTTVGRERRSNPFLQSW